jgi:hypothetical protein
MRRHPLVLRFLLLLLIPLFVPSVFSQSLRLGFKIGVRLAGEVSNSNLSKSFPEFHQDSSIADDSRPLASGPTVQVSLPARMSVESGVLYRSFAILSTTHTFETIGDPGDPFRFDLRVTRRIHSKSIEGPALLQFRLSDESLRPFVGAGYVYRHFLDPSVEILGSPTVVRPLAMTNRSNHGVAITGGLEVKIRFLRISPEIRYTRWGRRVFDLPGFPPATKLNHVDLFFGIGL